MSKKGDKLKAELARAKRELAEAEKARKTAPSASAAGDGKNRFYGFGLLYRVKKWFLGLSLLGIITAFFNWTTGGILNYFGSSPRILYLVAVALCFLICGLVMVGTLKLVTWLEQHPVQAVAEAREFIPGTKFTHGQLHEHFPFGYAIFSQRDGKWTHEPPPNETSKFTIDWEQVRIIPNYQEQTAEWRIPTSDYDHYPRHHVGRNIGFRKIVPMRIGVATPLRLLILPDDMPIPLVGTLSDNQRFPVFVLGFRIHPSPTSYSIK